MLRCRLTALSAECQVTVFLQKGSPPKTDLMDQKPHLEKHQNFFPNAQQVNCVQQGLVRIHEPFLVQGPDQNYLLVLKTVAQEVVVCFGGSSAAGCVNNQSFRGWEDPSPRTYAHQAST